jgi:hypothetical protein
MLGRQLFFWKFFCTFAGEQIYFSRRSLGDIIGQSFESSPIHTIKENKHEHMIIARLYRIKQSKEDLLQACLPHVFQNHIKFHTKPTFHRHTCLDISFPLGDMSSMPNWLRCGFFLFIQEHVQPATSVTSLLLMPRVLRMCPTTKQG